MYQRKLKLQKGFKDSIQIQFKNSDQKPISIGTGTFFLDMLDSAGRETVFSKELIINEYEINTGTSTATIFNKGLATLDITPAETINLVAGNYKMLVKKQNNDDPLRPSYTPAYSNTYYGITGDIEIAEDGFAIGYPIQTVTMQQLETAKDYDRDPADPGYVFVSPWLKPVERSTTNPTTSTAKITLASFKGTITVEGTLDNNPSGAGHANAQVFKVDGTATVFTATVVTEGIQTIEWHGPWTAIRFKVKPAKGSFSSNYYPTGWPVGSNSNKFPSGFIDQIQYIS